MSRLRKKIIISVFIFILLISSSVLGAESNFWEPNFNFEGKMGEGEFTGRGGVVYPLKTEEDSMVFTDLRTMFTGDVYEWNLGLGYRKIFPEKNLIAGGYLFRDYRNQYNSDWNQWTLGGEILTGDVDFRFNYYLPIEKRVLATNIPADEIVVVGNEVIYQQAVMSAYYETMGGYDLEIGKRFSENLPIDLGIYLRTFKFSNDSFNMEGSGIKIDTKFGDPDEALWNLGIDWQDDNIRGNNYEIVLGVSTPFGKSTENRLSSKSKLEQRMVEAPKRDIDIVISEGKPVKKVISQEEAVDPGNEETVTKIWYVTASGSGDGTRDNPTNLAELFSVESSLELTPNDIIVLLGDEGEIDVGNMGSLELYAGHKLLSPGGHIVLNSSVDSSRSAQYSPSGIQATLINSEQANDIVILADNTTVSGVKLTGEDGNTQTAIFGEIVTGEININNNVIDNTNNAINISTDNIMPGTAGDISGNKIVIEENTLDNIDSDGIEIYANSDTDNNISVNNNEIYYAGDGAIYINSQAFNDSNVDVCDNYIGEAGDIGIFVYSDANSESFKSSHVNITGNEIVKSDFAGIFARSSSETDSMVNISDNTLDNIGENIYLQTMGLGFEGAISIDNMAEEDAINIVSNNTINNSAMGGIFVNSYAVNDSNVDVHNNNIGEVERDGISVRSRTNSQMYRSSHVNITGNVIDRDGYSGINVEATSQTDSIVNISDNILKDSGNSSIDINEVNIMKRMPEGAITVDNAALDNIITNIENNTINNSLSEGIFVINDGSAFAPDSVASVPEVIEIPETVNIETTVSNNDLGNIEGGGILVELPYIPLEMTQEVNIENNNITSVRDFGIVAGNISYGYYQEDEFEKSTDVNINNNIIGEVSTSEIDGIPGYGIAVISGNGETVDAVITENEILNAESYGIALGASLAYERLYLPSQYEYTYYPSTLNALVQNNSIEVATDGGILIYTERNDDLEPPLESIVNVDEEILENENIFGNGIDPLIDYICEQMLND